MNFDQNLPNVVDPSDSATLQSSEPWPGFNLRRILTSLTFHPDLFLFYILCHEKFKMNNNSLSLAELVLTGHTAFLQAMREPN